MSDKTKTDTISVSQSDLKPSMRITADPDAIAIRAVGCFQWLDGPADLIETAVTPEMIEAGVSILDRFHDIAGAAELVEAIYNEMTIVRMTGRSIIGRSEDK